MKLKHNADLSAFLQAARSCQHEVVFISAENDRLNLKSQLCSYIFLVLAMHPELLERGEVLLEPDDVALMKDFVE